MAVWKELEGWTFEYFEPDIEPSALPGFEGLVRLMQDRRGGRVVPSWSELDFYDFKGWHGRLCLFEIFYHPFDYTCRLSGTEIDALFGRNMTGATASELAEIRIENPLTMEFYEMTCSRMLIARTSGSLNIERRDHLHTTFVEFPLSDDGLKTTHTLEAIDCIRTRRHGP